MLDEPAGRRALVAYGALAFARGLVAGTSGNLSVRLADGTILVTPSGRALRALDEDALVRCDADGVVLGEGRPTSELPLHVAAYRARADIRAVVHTHPTFATAWSKTGGLFPLDTVGAMESLGPVAFARYARSGTQELADVCAHAIGSAPTVVMERHGLTSVGATLEEAFSRSDLAEQTAHIEYLARTLPATACGG